MKFMALVAHALLWLAIAVSPTIVGLIIGFFLKAGDLFNLTVVSCGLIGFIIGGLWAERIRRTIGLAAFLGRLTGMPELKDRDKDS
jgi:hypothetical protein